MINPNSENIALLPQQEVPSASISFVWKLFPMSACLTYPSYLWPGLNSVQYSHYNSYGII